MPIKKPNIKETDNPFNTNNQQQDNTPQDNTTNNQNINQDNNPFNTNQDQQDNTPQDNNPFNTNEDQNNPFGNNDDNPFDNNASTPTLNLTDLGKIYTLNKVYSILNNLNNYVDDLLTINNKSTDLEKIKFQLSMNLDIFVLLSNNLDQYVDKLDEIINDFNLYIRYLLIYLKNNYKEIPESK